MTLDWSVVWEQRTRLFEGAALTVGLAAATMALALPLSLGVAVLRSSPIAAVRGAATAYVEFFRATPLILQIYWAFYVMPVVVGIALDPLPTALLGLVLNVTAYLSETVRGGLNSVRVLQRQAGLALGMTGPQVFRVVVLPQALRRVMPAIATTWVSLFKDTSLVSVIAVADLSYVALQLRAQTFRVFEFLTAMAALYWLMGYPQAKLVDYLYRRTRVAE
ncbi:MAG: amino acid ABC transporter permease [Acetobacteraceae bacterium]|nr:amino acid ABC transporter permease [Acetobacteraceae bacterium]